MARYKVILERNECVGAAACVALAPKVWKLNEDGKVDVIVKGAKVNKNNTVHEFEIDEKDFKKNLEAAESCPVNAIHIKNLDNGEDLI
ncbi:MAG TPA: ferredoxin [Candidatus Nanoarchaeia archaeon]|nr:ferredoxin [Candidatus Nanoarchaeia archaeon]